MSQTVLGGDITIYDGSENRQARWKWTGAATDKRTGNEVYSAFQDLFDNVANLGFGYPIKAVTPNAYRVGRNDPRGEFEWFVDRETMEHIQEAAFETVGWTRVEGSNNGIIRVTRDTSQNIVPGDIGLDITHADGDSGTLLDIVDDYLYIRPDSWAAANSFDSAVGGNLTCNAHVDPQLSGQASETGESLWPNFYSLGASLEGDDLHHLFVEQDSAQLVSADGGGADYWPDGHFDIAVLVKEVGVELDEAVIRAFQRQYRKTFTFSEVDGSAGGRNPMPLETGKDLGVLTGPYNLTLSGASGTWAEGDPIYTGASWGAATKKGIIVVGGSGATPTLEYYLIGDLTQFVNTETLDARLHAATGTINGVPAAQGPAILAGTSIAHGHDGTLDINNDGTLEDYSIVIDASLEPLQEVFEWSQWLQGRGGVTTGNTDGQAAQFYIGIQVKIAYTTLLGTVSEGDVVTQDTSGATGTVVAHDTTNKVVTLRTTRGTFNTSDDIVETEATNELQGAHVVTAISPVPAAPFGVLAGGQWLLAFGVALINVPAADANNYTAFANDGNTYAEPTQVTLLIGNTRQFDGLELIALTAAGGVKERNQYAVHASQPGVGSTSLRTAAAIGQYRPAAGRVVWYDADAGVEYVYRYTSYATDVFTLFTVASTTNDSATTTQITDAGAFGSVQVGDLVWNTTRSAYAYVLEVVSANIINLDREIAGQTNGDTYEIGTTRSVYDASDEVYVPYILFEEDTGTPGSPGSQSVNVVYNVPVPVVARARQAGDIQSWEGEGTIESTGFSVNIARNADEIFA